MGKDQTEEVAYEFGQGMWTPVTQRLWFYCTIQPDTPLHPINSDERWDELLPLIRIAQR